jgi:hypothetical protein
MVGNWLYGVARQTALNSRAGNARRQALEIFATTMPEPATTSTTPDDLRLALDRELSQLPDRYRAAIVSCDLEGQTRKAAARRLGVPEGTLAGRLTRGRALLARRLARRGVLLSAGVLAELLTEEAVSAPPELVASTINATTSCATGVPAGDHKSREVVMTTMRRSRLQSVAVRIGTLGALAGGLVLVALAGFARQPDSAESTRTVAAAGGFARAAEPADPDDRPTDPRYCWLEFGPKAKPRVLVRIDGKEIAVDLNGDGKFNGKGERFKSLKDCKDVTIAGADEKTSYVMTEVVDLGVIPPAKFVEMVIEIRGKLNFRQAGWIELTKDAKDAPVARFDGPLALSPEAFALENRARRALGKFAPDWLAQLAGPGLGADTSIVPKSLKRSDPTTLWVRAVTEGENSIVGTLATLDPNEKQDDPTRRPAGVHPFADVVFPAKKPGDPDLKRRYPLDQVWQGFYRGTVTVPAEVGVGRGKITFSFDSWPGTKVAPCTLDIPIEDPPAEEAQPKK